jgi:hypothetical protein
MAAELTAATCDRCGPSTRAAVRVELPGDLFLDFCGHHYHDNQYALADVAVKITELELSS